MDCCSQTTGAPGEKKKSFEKQPKSHTVGQVVVFTEEGASAKADGHRSKKNSDHGLTVETIKVSSTVKFQTSEELTQYFPPSKELWLCNIYLKPLKTSTVFKKSLSRALSS